MVRNHHCREIVVDVAGHSSRSHVLIHPFHAGVHVIHERPADWLRIHLGGGRR